MVYGPCLDMTTSARIRKVQNSCIRLTFSLSRGDHVSQKPRELHWLNMFNRRKCHLPTFVYNILHNKVPLYLYEKLTFRSSIHNYKL
nr:unnamed protein product [Callosobruchus analis]